MNLPELKVVAWDIMVHEHQNGYLVDDLNEACDDLTNHGAIATPLVTLSDAQQSIKDAYEQGKKDAEEKLTNDFTRHVGGDGEFWLHELHDFVDNRAAPKQEKNDEPV